MLYLYISDPFELSCKSAPCFYSVFYSVGVSALFVTSQNELQTSPFVNDSNVTICAPFFFISEERQIRCLFSQDDTPAPFSGEKSKQLPPDIEKKVFFFCLSNKPFLLRTYFELLKVKARTKTRTKGEGEQYERLLSTKHLFKTS